MDLARPHSGLAPGLEGDILVALAAVDDEMTGRHVARMIGASPSGALRALSRLVADGLVRERAAGRARLFSLNRDHLAAQAVECLAGLRQRLLDQLRDQIDRWEVAPVHASLFGSAARRDGSAASDIDVFLVRSDGANRAGWDSQVDALRDSIERWTGNRAQIVELGEEDLAENIASGTPVLADIKRDAVDLAGRAARQILKDAR